MKEGCREVLRVKICLKKKKKKKHSGGCVEYVHNNGRRFVEIKKESGWSLYAVAYRAAVT